MASTLPSNFKPGLLGREVFLTRPEMHFDFVNYFDEYHDLIVGLMGSPGLVNYAAMEGAREAAKHTRAGAPVSTGLLAKSAKAKGVQISEHETLIQLKTGRVVRRSHGRRRTQGSKVVINQRGDGKDPKRPKGGGLPTGGTRVKYGTPVHQGVESGNRFMVGRPFLYRAIDSNRESIERRIEQGWDKVIRKLAARSKVLDGAFGAAAQRELLSRLRKTGTKNVLARTEKTRAAQMRAADRGHIQIMASRLMNDVVEKEVRALKLDSLVEVDLSGPF